jgi:AraC family transcriptional regulator
MLKLDKYASDSVRVRSWEAPDKHSAKRYSPNSHDDLEVTWVEEGGMITSIGGRTLALHQGQCIVVPAAIEHSTEFPLGALVSTVHLKASIVEEIGETVGMSIKNRSYIIPSSQERLIQLGRLLHREALERQVGAFLAIDALAEVFTIEALRTNDSGEELMPRSSRLSSGIRAAIELIETSYSEPLSVIEMARVAAMSRYHFSRLFREQTGQSPYQYLVDVRIARAAAELRRGGVTITEVALNTGFSDLSRFGRHFRQRMGMTPQRYLDAARRSARIGDHQARFA